MGTNWEMRVTPMEIIGIMQGSMLGPFSNSPKGPRLAHSPSHRWPREFESGERRSGCPL